MSVFQIFVFPITHAVFITIFNDFQHCTVTTLLLWPLSFSITMEEHGQHILLYVPRVWQALHLFISRTKHHGLEYHLCNLLLDLSWTIHFLFCASVFPSAKYVK